MSNIRCCTLPDACLDILPNPNTLEQWRRGIRRGVEPAQFRLHVAGLSEPAIRSMEKSCLLGVHDPLFPSRLRHIERDRSCIGERCMVGLVHEPQRESMLRGRTRGAHSTNLTMLWPEWENGYGDVEKL